MWREIVEIIPGLCEIYLLITLLDICFDRRFDNKYIYILWGLSDIGVVALSHRFSDIIGYALIISILFEVLTLRILYKSGAVKILFWIVCYNSILGICDIIVCMLVISIGNIGMEELLDSFLLNNISAMLSKFLLWVVIVRFKSFFNKTEQTKGNYYIPLLVIPIITLGSIYLIIDYYINTSEKNRNDLLVYIVIVGLCFVNILVYYVYNRLGNLAKIREEYSLMEQQLVYQRKYFSQVERSYQEVRSLKHDINRHITLISTLAMNHEYDKLEEYVMDLGSYTNNMVKIIQTGNVILDAILNEKSTLANNLDIKINFTVEQIGQDVINPTSLCIIVSNVLDNAIEACKEIEGEVNDSSIEVKLYTQKNNLVISVINDAQEPKQENGFYLTSKKNKLEHGIGLKNVKRVIDENNGYMEVGYSDGKFIFVCRIPMNL